MDREREYNDLMRSLPKELIKTYQESPLVHNVIRTGFKNGSSKEEILINIIIFLYHDNNCLNDRLINREMHRVQSSFYKAPTPESEEK